MKAWWKIFLNQLLIKTRSGVCAVTFYKTKLRQRTTVTNLIHIITLKYFVDNWFL